MKTPEIVEKVKELVAPLDPVERLHVIRAIEEMEPVTKLTTPEKRRDQMLAEQEKWFAQPLEVRARYRDKYIAVRDGRVVDQDESQTALLLRVRKDHPDAPIPILNGAWDEAPIFEFRSIVRFLNQFTGGLGNYTEERRDLIEGQTLEEVLADVYTYQAKRPPKEN